MDFSLGKEHVLARQLFKEFAEKEVKPLAIEVDEKHEFPRETVTKMQKYGFMGIPFPRSTADRAATLLHTLCVLKSFQRSARPPVLSYPLIPHSAAIPL